MGSGHKILELDNSPHLHGSFANFTFRGFHFKQYAKIMHKLFILEKSHWNISEQNQQMVLFRNPQVTTPGQLKVRFKHLRGGGGVFKLKFFFNECIISQKYCVEISSRSEKNWRSYEYLSVQVLTNGRDKLTSCELVEQRSKRRTPVTKEEFWVDKYKKML